MEVNNLNGKLEDEQNLVAQLQKKIKELQVHEDSLIQSGGCRFSWGGPWGSVQGYDILN